MRRARAVCLDLDDTLWAIGPVIRRAEEEFFAWLADHYPRVTETSTVASLRARREALAVEWYDRIHDLAALRRELYRELAAESGYGEAMVDDAFTEFQRLRNQVILFDDVLPALDQLRGSRRLVALTNGNADLEVIGLAGHFDQVFTAAAIGAAKPDPRVFDAVCTSLGLRADEIVHAGDDPERDIIAPRAFGMSVVWINRDGRDWPAAHALPPHTVRDLHGLVALLDP